ncbi:MAG: cation transporter, partial [Chloroflexi bacterium]|nr:cation transporter [Chloroflexota bacterium]
MTTIQEATIREPQTRKISLSIEGMTCAACVVHVEHALRDVPGVDLARVNLATEKAMIDLTDDVALDQLAAALKDAGYGARVEKQILHLGGTQSLDDAQTLTRAFMAFPGIRWVSVENGDVSVEYYAATVEISDMRAIVTSAGFAVTSVDEQFDRHALAKTEEAAVLRRKFLVALIGGGIVMAVSMLYMIPAFQVVSSQPLNIFLFVLATPIQFWAGSQFYTGAWSAFRHKTSNMNTLIAVGTSAAYLYSVVATFAPEV